MAFSITQKKSDLQSLSQDFADQESKLYLNKEQFTILKSLFSKKDCFLFSKEDDLISISCKIDEIFSEVISSYIYTYNDHLKKSSSEHYLAENEFQITLSLKGKDAEDIYRLNKKNTNNSDHDFLLKINKLPHNPTDYYKNNKFYTEVALRAIGSLLEKKTKQKFSNESCSSYLRNLLLFKDNSIFLFTLGEIDISFTVPGISELEKKRYSTFLHESIKISFPFFSKNDLEKDICYFSSEFTNDWQTINDSFSEKKIIIPNPQSIQHNGFERLVYSISKGWTTNDDKAVKILLEDFEKRILDLEQSQCKFFFADRFFKLLTKKELQPTAILNNYLNAFELAKLFNFKQAEKELEMAYNHQKWLSIFPEFVNIFFENNYDVNLLIKFWIFKTHLDIQNDVIVTNHLGSNVLVSGQDGKNNGYYLSKIYSLKEIDLLCSDIFTNMGSKNFFKLIDEIFPEFVKSKLKFKEKIYIRYFFRFLRQKNYTEHQLLEFKEQFSVWINYLYKNNNFWLIGNVRNDLIRFFENKNPTTYSLIKEPDFFVAVLKNHEFTNLIFLIHQFLIGDHEKLDFFLTSIKKTDPYKKLISNLLLEAKLLSEFKYIQLLEKCLEFNAVNSIETTFIQHIDKIKTIIADRNSTHLISIKLWKLIFKNLSTETSWELCIDLIDNKSLLTKLFDSIITNLSSSKTKSYFLNHLYKKNAIELLETSLKNHSNIFRNEFLKWRTADSISYFQLLLISSEFRKNDKNILEFISKAPLIDILKLEPDLFNEIFSNLDELSITMYFIDLIKNEDQNSYSLIEKLIKNPHLVAKMKKNKNIIKKELLKTKDLRYKIISEIF